MSSTPSTTALRTLGACIARCDLEIAELVSAPMAAGLATSGAKTNASSARPCSTWAAAPPGMAVFAEGQLLHTAQLPIGGLHVTNDSRACSPRRWRMRNG